jgi:DNA-binding MarR family transcriptional regulator
MYFKKLPKQQSKCYCINMRRASKAITQYYDKLLEPIGLKITQYSLLNNLRRISPATINELSKAVRLERSTLVRNLNRLKEMDLVNIESDKTTQAHLINLSDKGIRTLDAAIPFWDKAQLDTKEMLTEEEFDIFMVVLQKLESFVP